MVWLEVSEGIFFSRSTDGAATFSLPRNLSPQGTFVFGPQMAVDGSGMSTLWTELVGPANR